MAVTFKSHYREVTAAVQEATDRALEIAGAKAEGYAKANLTRNGSVITGNLRNSITHRQVSSDTEVIGTNVNYAPFVELGHHQEPGRYVPAIKKRLKRRFVPGKPYLRPAAEGHGEEYAKIWARELNKINK